MISQINCYVYPFCTPNSNYLYDATTNSVIKVSQGIYNHFRYDLELNNADKLTLDRLKQMGYITGSCILRIEQSSSSILNNILEQKVHSITLQVTQQCNLRCQYCVYSGAYEGRIHNYKRMEIEIARQGIDFILKHSTGLDKIAIGFYGGEPLLEFDLIKYVVSYAKKASVGKKIHWHISTNGTLFNDKILEFLQRNEFYLLLSMDGPKDIHDRNRVFAANGKGTFDVIMKNIDYIQVHYKKLYEKILLNAVIDPLLDHSCSNSFFVKLNKVNISTTIINPDYRKEELHFSEQYLVTDEVELFKSILGQLGKISKESISHVAREKFETLQTQMLTLRSKSTGLQETVHPGGPCVPGARKLFLSADGDFYPCERVSEGSKVARIGSLSKGFDYEQVKIIYNIGKLTETECKSCWAIRMCNQCIVAADDNGELSRKKKLSHCKQTKSNIDSLLKDYVTFIEYGYVFDDNDPLLTFKDITL